MFVEVNSLDKNCPVIINLDQVIEIAPLAAGGCQISFTYDGDMGTREMKVSNSYNQFKQFAMQTVTGEDIQNRINQIKKISK
jgi:hypothetical protein